jgi:hypothetical protein
MGTLLGDKDADYADRLTREVNRLSGTCAITYYALNFFATPKDPLYGEPVMELHERDRIKDAIGVNFSGLLEYPEQSQRTGEEGYHNDYDAILHLARADFDEKFPIVDAPDGTPKYREPRIGDVIKVQDRYYDLISIDLDGQMNDNIARHTIWLLKLKHRTEFDARRRVEGQE